MKYLAFLLSFLFFQSVFAQKMVFMRESSEGKHMWLYENESFEALTQGTLWNLYPTISADGEWLAWIEAENEKNSWVKIRHLLTKKEITLKSPSQGLALHPHFSKNGQWLTFVFKQNGVDERSQIQLFPMQQFYESRQTWRTLEIEGEFYFPKLSSDGSFIIAQRNLLLQKEIVQIETATKKIEALTLGMSPSLSFDEKLIAFTHKDKRWGIRLFNRSTKTITQMTQPLDHDDMAPTFDQNNHLVFASNQNGNYHLYRLNQGEKIQMTNTPADDYAPQFSGETQWKQDFLPAIPGPARSSFASISFEGKIYVCGGHQGSEHTYPPESFNQQLFSYDIATKTWTELAVRPHKAHGFQLAAFGKYLYAFGGFSYEAQNRPRWKSLDVIDRYNIETNTWETIGKMPRARSSNVAITIDDKVYLIGGWDSTPKFPNDLDGTFHPEIDIFDLKTETMSVAHYQLPLPLRRAFSGTSYQGKILLVGGLGVGASHFSLLNQVTLMDPLTGFSSELPLLPFGTFAPAVGIIGQELFVFGGMFKIDEQNYEYVSHIYGLNLENQTWRHVGRYLSETKGFSQVIELSPTELGILGGHHYSTDHDSPVSTFEVFKKP